MLRALALLTLVSAFAIQSTGCNAEPPLDVAPSVDLSRFQGKWYEIASLPRVAQTDCFGTTAFYTQAADGSFQFVNQCNVASTSGPLKTVTMTATVPDKSVPSKLALDVGGLPGDYWILEVGQNYEYAVVGHPSRLYLWILSRTPRLDPATAKGVIDRAQSSHFDTSKLQFTPQPPAGERVSSNVPVPGSTAQTGGCSASRAMGSNAGAWCLGLFVAATALLRSRDRAHAYTPRHLVPESEKRRKI
jgi:apolipoprotein D and lipocalin family protein